MSNNLLFRGRVVTADRIIENGAVACAGDRITAVGQADAIATPQGATVIDAGDGYISPGFVDQHVHGARGHDFMDGTTEAVVEAIKGHTRYGTTSIFPTTTTGRPEQIEAMLDACEAAAKSWKPGDHARLAGVHFYGPYFATDKVGAHPKGYERDPDPAEYMAAFDRDIIKVATCAAELPGAIAFYREAYKRGCLVTCGHSNASFNEMKRGFDAGLRHVDHMWCAMSNVSSIRLRLGEPMQASMAEFVLIESDMSTEVIADGEHIAPDLLEYTYRMKGAEKLCLVTDANRAVDMPEGEYKIGPQENGEPFINNGKVGVCPSGGLASSIVGMDHMVRIMVRDTSCGVVNGIRMASLTPAELIGIADEVGSLAVGKRADVVVLDDGLHTQRVFTAGVECSRDQEG